MSMTLGVCTYILLDTPRDTPTSRVAVRILNRSIFLALDVSMSYIKIYL
jgi:hypothetical protein